MYNLLSTNYTQLCTASNIIIISCLMETILKEEKYLFNVVFKLSVYNIYSDFNLSNRMKRQLLNPCLKYEPMI